MGNDITMVSSSFARCFVKVTFLGMVKLSAPNSKSVIRDRDTCRGSFQVTLLESPGAGRCFFFSLHILGINALFPYSPFELIVGFFTCGPH